MANRSRSHKRRSSPPRALYKARGIVHPRVQAVGPAHFAFLSIDSAKARSKLLLADFYGRVLVAPTVVEHDRSSFDEALQRLRDAMTRHTIKDVIAVVERAGRYHGPIQRALTHAGLEVRIIHPHTTKQYRQPADPGNKTDDTDLAAIHRAAVNGFGLLEHEPHPLYVRLQLLARHRRRLVNQNSKLRQQMLEHLHAYMPGYSRCCPDLFHSELQLWVAKELGSAAAVRAAGLGGMTEQAKIANVSPHKPTFLKILAWAKTAPSAEEPTDLHRRFFIEFDADRRSRLAMIRAIECELAELLSQTPYVLLLSVPGINVVSAAEFAGEMGPIEHYTKARAITARAGLFPARYQSDQVDRCNGPLVRHGNRDLRRAATMIADNLIRLNDHFAMLAQGWRNKNVNAKDLRVRVASRFCRIAYQMVAGRSTFRHPCSQSHDSVLTKLVGFALDHEIAADRLARSLDAATAQLPVASHAEEAGSLADEMAVVQKKRGAGPRAIGEILPAVLAKLGGGLIPLTTSGEGDPT